MTINSFKKQLSTLGITVETQLCYSEFRRKNVPVRIKPSALGAEMMGRNGRAYSITYLFHLTNQNGEKLALGLDDVTCEGGGSYAFAFRVCPIEDVDNVFYDKQYFWWSNGSEKSLKSMSDRVIRNLKGMNFITVD